MRGRLATPLLAALIALAAPAAAGAQSPYPPGPFAPWDGSNPFNCEIQDVGTGVDFPDPDADPFCVEFDKTQQNVTDLGILEFLANEPARVAAALPKCFYYQHDHWTGAVVQGEPSTELWNWDGSYFFDKAYAVGGVHVDNFRLFGFPASPADYGQVPPEFEPYLGPGGGGAYVIGDIEADPECVARAQSEPERIYAGGAPPPRPGDGQSATPRPPRRCANLIVGTPGPDRLLGTAGGDRILGRAGDDVIRGFRGADCLLGHGGDDRIFGGPGNDRIFGGRGRDRLFGGPGNDRIFGGPGDDVIRTGRGNNLVRPGPGRNVVICGPGRNRVRGGSGDRLIGC